MTITTANPVVGIFLAFAEIMLRSSC